MSQRKRANVKPLAIFFYTTEPTQVQVVNIDAYFDKSGYLVGYRKQLDPVGARDIIELDAVCVSGAYPTVYDAKFADRTDVVLDKTAIESIMDGTAEKAPVPGTPRERMAMATGDDAGTEKVTTETVQTAMSPTAPTAPVAPPAP